MPVSDARPRCPGFLRKAEARLSRETRSPARRGSAESINQPPGDSIGIPRSGWPGADVPDRWRREDRQRKDCRLGGRLFPGAQRLMRCMAPWKGCKGLEPPKTIKRNGDAAPLTFSHPLFNHFSGWFQPDLPVASSDPSAFRTPGDASWSRHSAATRAGHSSRKGRSIQVDPAASAAAMVRPRRPGDPSPPARPS